MRDDPDAEMKCVLGDNTISGPIHGSRVSLQFGRNGIEVLIDSASGDGSKSWVVISRGLKDMSRNFGNLQTVHVHRHRNSAGRKF